MILEGSLGGPQHFTTHRSPRTSAAAERASTDLASAPVQMLCRSRLLRKAVEHRRIASAVPLLAHTERFAHTFGASISDAKAAADPAVPQTLFTKLRLASFSDEELKKRFAEADLNGDGILSRSEVQQVLRGAKEGLLCDSQLDEKSEATAAALVLDGSETISYDAFAERMKARNSSSPDGAFPASL